MAGGKAGQHEAAHGQHDPPVDQERRLRQLRRRRRRRDGDAIEVVGQTAKLGGERRRHGIGCEQAEVDGHAGLPSHGAETGFSSQAVIAEMFSRKDLCRDRRALAVETDEQLGAIFDARQLLKQVLPLVQFLDSFAAGTVVVREPALRFVAIVGAGQHDEAFTDLVAFRLQTAVNQPHHHRVGRGLVVRLDYT